MFLLSDKILLPPPTYETNPSRSLDIPELTPDSYSTPERSESLPMFVQVSSDDLMESTGPTAITVELRNGSLRDHKFLPDV